MIDQTLPTVVIRAAWWFFCDDQSSTHFENKEAGGWTVGNLGCFCVGSCPDLVGCEEYFFGRGWGPGGL